MRLKRYLLSFFTVIIGRVFFDPAVMAQNTLWQCPTDLTLRLAWLTSENAAGLTTLSANDKASEVSLYGKIFSGDMHNYNEAHDGYRWGLKGVSYYPVSERVAVWGEVNYSKFQGNDMTGSYFIDPSQAPFNLVEYTEGNPGDKQLETYHLTGAVGVNLSRRFSGGLKMDYTAANYAKRKDLRHTNSLMDMTVTAGLKYRLAERFTLGVDYAYRRRNESLLLSMYGTTDKLYYTLVDYGAFFGKRELFSDTGYTKENEAKPLFDTYHGGALQFSWSIGKHWEWFNEVGFRMRDGSYGYDSPSTIVYSAHTGESLTYRGHLVYESLRNTHTLRVTVEQCKVKNRENIYDFRNDDVGINYYIYLGNTEVGTHTEQKISLQYTGLLGIEQGLPLWMLDVKMDYDYRKQKAVNYPDYRHQNIAWWRLAASLRHNILSDRNLYTAGVDFGYGAGSGFSCKDGRFTTSNESETLTRTLDMLLMRDYEYHTASRIQTGANIRYTRHVGQKGMRGYVELNYNFCKAFNTTYLDHAMRHILSIQIGCNF